jgi:tetratricopeptide (TPR) repeat protein
MYSGLTTENVFSGPNLAGQLFRLRDGIEDRNGAIRVLINNHLMQPLSSAAYRIPSSVAHEIIDGLQLPSQQQWIENALATIDAKLPSNVPANWSVYDRLLPHAAACLRHASRVGCLPRTMGSLVHQFADHLLRREKYQIGEMFWEWAIAVAEAEFGPDHAVVGLDLEYLAMTRVKLGKNNEVETLFSRACKILKNAGSHSELDWAICLHNLATFYSDQGRYKEARRLFGQSLPILEARMEGTPGLVEALEDYAKFLALSGHPADAESVRTRARKLLSATRNDQA